MPYHRIPVDTKIDAVMDHFKGLKPSEIERKRLIDRDSLRLWVRKAEAAIRAALTPKPGRPPKKCAESIEISSQKSQGSIATEPVQVFPSSRTVLSVKCPLCGSGRVAKNGCYNTGGKRKPLKRVQRFVCQDCGANLYQGKKNSNRTATAFSLSKRGGKRPNGRD